MIHGELRYLHSPDLPDLRNQKPERVDHFGILVQAIIGPSNQLGEDSFDFMVCTPNWFTERLEQTEYLFGMNYLFINKYDYDLLHNIIVKLCQRSEGDNWDAVAKKIGRYGKWEFEDYQPF